jgi:hypothetical protein
LLWRGEIGLARPLNEPELLFTVAVNPKVDNSFGLVSGITIGRSQ